MSTYQSIRAAIQSEITAISAQLKKLTTALSHLGGDDGRDSTPATGKKRGRKPGSKNKAKPAASSEADLAKALELLKEAGKSGIKAIKLSYMLKSAGHTKVGKRDLLGSEKVKMTGKGGASTYVYTA